MHFTEPNLEFVEGLPMQKLWMMLLGITARFLLMETDKVLRRLAEVCGMVDGDAASCNICRAALDALDIVVAYIMSHSTTGGFCVMVVRA